MRFPRKLQSIQDLDSTMFKDEGAIRSRFNGGANFRLAFLGNRQLKVKHVRFQGSVLVQKGTLFSIDFNQ